MNTFRTTDSVREHNGQAKHGWTALLAENVLKDFFTNSHPPVSRDEASGLNNIMHWKNYNDPAAPLSAPASVADVEMSRNVDRRTAVKAITAGLAAGFGILSSACSVMGSEREKEISSLNWEEYFKGNYRLMTETEKTETVERLERLHELSTGKRINVSTSDAIAGVLFGYAFNISKCRGYMDCIRGCLSENNQDRKSGMKYIRIHEHKKGQINFEHAQDNFFHEVPSDGHFYMGTQCFHCEKPALRGCLSGSGHVEGS